MFMHQNGFTQTVGVCGSALTISQISLLVRYCSEFYLMFDPDAAGRDAIERALKLYREYDLGRYGISFIPVFLPKGYDPDDFIKKMGRRKMKKKLMSAKEEIIF